MSTASHAAPSPPKLIHLYTLHATIHETLYIAAVPGGTRNVYPIKGGQFSGPRLKGEVLDLGADWGLIEPKTSIFHADTRYALKTDDGTFIYVRTSGPSQPESAGGGLHLRGVFEVGEGAYWWLNHVVAIGTTQEVDKFDGGFVLKIEMWYMASPNDQLETPANVGGHTTLE